MTEFPIVPARTGLLFFDCLNVYLHPKDAEAAREVEASGVFERFQRIERACRESGMAVFYAQADHREDNRDVAQTVVDLGHRGKPGEPPRLSGVPGVSAGSWEAEIIPEIAPKPGDYVIKKHRWSTFFQTHFELSLRTAGINTLIIAGGSTEIGVASTAYAGRDLDFNLVILRDACTSNRPDVQEMLMNRVFPVFARVMTVEEAIGQFARAEQGALVGH